MSKQGDKIENIVNTSDKHLTAEEIFMLCRQDNFAVSLATVYRNLGLLVSKGKINKVSIAGEPDRYDKTVAVHDHIICSKCKKVTDIHIQNLKEILEEKTGMSIDSYDLCLHYVCPECKKQQD